MNRSPAQRGGAGRNETVQLTASDGMASTALAHNTAGLECRYRRSDQSSWTTVTLVAGTLATFTSGGFVHDRNGKYQFGVPTACFAAGDWVDIEFSGAGLATVGNTLKIVMNAVVVPTVANVNNEPLARASDLPFLDSDGNVRLYRYTSSDVFAGNEAGSIAFDADATGSVQILDFVQLSWPNKTVIGRVSGVTYDGGDDRTYVVFEPTNGVPSIITALGPPDRATVLSPWAIITATRGDLLLGLNVNNLSARLGTLPESGTVSTLTAAQVEAALLNDADGQALLAAISAKVQTLFDTDTDVPISTLVSLIASRITSDHGSGSYVRNTEPDNAGIAAAASSSASAATNTSTLLTNLASLAGKFTGITSVANWLRSLFRSSEPDATALTEINDSGGTWNAATHSPQAIRAKVDTLPTSLNVVISPGTTTVESSGSQQVFGAKRVDRKFTQGESGTFTVSCFDADGEPIDLNGQTLKLILHEEGDDEPIVALSTPTITIGTGDNKHVATIPVATLTTVKRRCMYVFRSTTLGNTVRMFGVWDVRAAPVG